jgi:hypothetical protein
MATLYLTNHLYPDNPQLIIIDVQQVVKFSGEPNTSFWQAKRGEHYWEIVIYTSGVDSSGELLGPYWIDIIETEQTVHELINDKIDEISSKIDWSKAADQEVEFLAQSDRYAPVVHWTYPSDGQVNVPIDSTIIVRLRDILPAKGIDINTLIFKVDGYTLNPSVTGNKYDYVLSYKPLVGV